MKSFYEFFLEKFTDLGKLSPEQLLVDIQALQNIIIEIN